MESSTVDAYIAQFPEAVQDRLRSMRAIIRDEAPEAKEQMAYNMPSYTMLGPLVHMAAFARHISLYAAYPDDPTLQDRCRPYVAGKGTVQFRHDREFPADLIRELVRRRVSTQRLQWNDQPGT